MWKDIPEFEGYYQISTEGEIRSVDRVINNQFIKGKILKPALDRSGYYKITLHKNGSKNYRTIHRLVGITFIPNPSNLPMINHKNGITTDNRVENLEWCDQSYNQWHRCHVNHNPPNNDYKQIKVRSIEKDGTIIIHDSITKCGDYFHVTRTAVERKLKGKSSNPSLKECSKLYGVKFEYVD